MKRIYLYITRIAKSFGLLYLELINIWHNVNNVQYIIIFMIFLIMCKKQPLFNINSKTTVLNRNFKSLKLT